MAIVAGQKVKASDLNNLAGVGSILAADSSSVNNSTVLVSTGLVVALSANSMYEITGWFWHNASAPPDCKIGWLVPVGATGRWNLFGPYVGATPIASNKRINYIDHGSADFTGTLTIGGDTTFQTVGAHIRGYISTSATAGNITMQFAQGTATAVNTNIKIGSSLRAIKLA